MFSDSKHEIVFAAKDVPPMGLNLYYVAYNASIPEVDEEQDYTDDGEDETYFAGNTFGSKVSRFVHHYYYYKVHLAYQ